MSKFSVIIPLFNKRDYVDRTLMSVFSQKGVDFECIVVDDGSTDDGLDFIRDNFDFSNLKLLRKENGGASSARNYGARASDGKYLIFLDADDELLDGALAEYESLVSEFGDCVAWGLNFKIQRSGLISSKKQYLKHRKDRQEVDYFEGVCKGGTYLTSSSACIDRGVYFELEGFDENLVQREDPHLWVRIALRGKVAFSRKELVIYHQDDVGRICVNNPAIEEFADSVFLADALEKGKVDSCDTRNVRAVISQNKELQCLQNLKVGRYVEARLCIKETKFRYASNKLNYVALLLLVRFSNKSLVGLLLRVRFACLSLLKLKF